jgi:beta-lactamase class A
MLKKYILDTRKFIERYEVQFVAILGLCIGISSASIYYELSNNEKIVHVEKRQGFVGFINPLLECSSSGSYGLKIYGLDDRLQDFVSNLISENRNIKDINLYFKDLNNGPELSIRGNVPIEGGSLIKVPLMIGYLKISENDPSYLSRKIKISESDIGNLYKIQGIVPQVTLKVGKKYSLMNLINSAIIHSDNVASVILENYDNNRSLKMVTEEMDISISSKFPPYRAMSIKDYSGFFRILYNSSYLDRSHSKIALEILSRVNFQDGLRSGLPPNIIISHKFGEKISISQKEKYFNDCGIIYHPIRPYLLCISTLGSDKKDQMNSIAQISNFVFNEVNKM